MDEQLHIVGERADKFCAVCAEERGHIITSVTKRGRISRVNCPKCGTVSTFKRAARTAQRRSLQPGANTTGTHTYRTGRR